MTENVENPNSSAVESAGCSCGCCGAAESPAAEAPAVPATPVASDDEGGKRKGFHPVLVVSTIVVVIFVLWFCPAVLIRARIPANEEAAQKVLQSDLYLLLGVSEAERENMLRNSRLSGDLESVKLVSRNFVPVRAARTESGGRAVVLTPRYYGLTARNSYCLLGGRLFYKDAGASLTSDKPMQMIDNSWTELKQQTTK